MKLFNKIKDYFKGSISEMKKVVWPTKKQTTRYSIIVVALSLGVALFFGILDYVFNIGLEAIIRDEDSSITQEDNLPVETSLPDFELDGVETSPVEFQTKSAE
ncbi:preprotein translocase subunit SecE [Patescibacteria group bacterium]|nr:preprotein translocase subunit SecE [Patescibacteria group bacterium]MBU1895682.1 preprotein translocase subunit SecE [Patescibacteria group bacterium]